MSTNSVVSPDRGYWPRFEPNHGPRRHTIRSQADRDDRLSSNKDWRAPAFMLFSLVIGLSLALAHHFMCRRLDNRHVADVSMSQAWVFRFSTALAFLVKVAFATSIGTAYVQHQWLRLHQQTFKINEIDAITSVLGSLFSFLTSAVWLKHPVLLLMALISWFLPFVAIVAPGSLTVSPVRITETIDVQVRQPDFKNSTAFSMGVGTTPRMRPDVRLSRLTYQVAVSGNPVPFLPTHANSSYHLDFDGPSLRCTSASDAVILNVTSDLGTSWGLRKAIYQKWASWTGQYPTGRFHASEGEALERFTEHSKQHGPRLSIMTNRGWNGWHKFVDVYSDEFRENVEKQVVNVTECVMFYASYSVDFVFQNGAQTQNISISKWLYPALTDEAFDNETIGSAASTAVMQALGMIMIGGVRQDGLRTTVTSLGQEMLNIDWDGEPQAIQRSLEQLSQYLTLSFLSNDDFLMDSTHAKWVPVEVFTWPNIYEYAMSDLLVTYGAAFICSFICSTIGLYAFFVNRSSYQNLFSTYFRATNDLDLRSQLVTGDHGADPLPKTLAQSRVDLGKFVNDSGLGPERADYQSLNIDETGISSRLN